MSRLDRYILRQFVLTFMFGILAFVIIYVAVDLMEHLDDFFDHNVPTSIILEFYLTQIPDIIHLIVPISMLLASLFTIGRLDQMNELTAMRSAGRSMRRIALPLFFFGLLVSVVMVYFDGWVVPRSNKRHFAIERKYLGKDIITGQTNVHLRISPTVNLLMEYFDATRGEARMVSIERFDTNARVEIGTLRRTSATEFRFDTNTTVAVKITERIDASTMRYDSVKKLWVLLDGAARNFENASQIVTTGFDSREIPFLPITPEELNLSQQKIGELTIEEFRERIEQERLSGRDVNRLMVDFYARFSFPFSAMIVVFFGLPFSSNQRKSGAAVQIAITALVSAIYLVLSEISKTFSYGDMLDPIFIAWAVNILFFLVGVGNLFRVERG